MSHESEAAMTLAELRSSGVGGRLVGSAEQRVTGVQHDSRRIVSGDLFVAMPGQTHDGARFVDVAEERSITEPGFGMGVSFGDYDNDGDLDLHITNMSSTAGNRILRMLYPEGHEIRETLSKQAAGNSLYERRDDGTFREVTSEVGGLSGGWAFGGGFIDFDNDGWEDLYTPNGFVSGKSMKDT